MKKAGYNFPEGKELVYFEPELIWMIQMFGLLKNVMRRQLVISSSQPRSSRVSVLENILMESSVTSHPRLTQTMKYSERKGVKSPSSVVVMISKLFTFLSCSVTDPASHLFMSIVCKIWIKHFWSQFNNNRPLWNVSHLVFYFTSSFPWLCQVALLSFGWAYTKISKECMIRMKSLKLSCPLSVGRGVDVNYFLFVVVILLLFNFILIIICIYWNLLSDVSRKLIWIAGFGILIRLFIIHPW